MKKTVLLAFTLLLLTTLSAFSQGVRVLKETPKLTVEQLLQQGINKNDVTRLANANTISNLGVNVPKRVYPIGDVRNNTKPMNIAKEAAQTIELYAVAQSYHKGYTFSANDGDVFSYNITLTREGNKVTLNNLFDMEAQSANSWSVSKDLPVEGVYDEAAKTITIPVGTVCGDYGGYYDAILSGGTVSDNGVLTPSTEVVFDVEGNFERITAREAVAATYTYGTIRIYKSFTAAVAKANEANLISFTEDMNFAETFVGNETTRTVQIINTGGMDADFSISLDSDDDSYTVAPQAGTVPAKSVLELVFTLKNNTAGEYEGIATLTYDKGTTEGNLVFSMNGKVKDYPDYSAIVKNGDIAFTTGIDFPFEMTELGDGTKVAQSGTHGAYGQSYLEATFTVPEGKLATFSWKGKSNNSSIWYDNAGGYFVDNLNEAVATFTGVDQDLSGSVELAPGEHFVRFQYDGYKYTGLEENKLYVYDLSLTSVAMKADAAELLTPEINLGDFVLKTGEVKSTINILIRNKGANELKVTSAVSDNNEFVPMATADGAATLSNVVVPVEFSATTAGEKTANITVVTTAGTFNVLLKASVMNMPDFASLVKEGAEYMTFDVNEQFPFIVENGKAWNKNAGKANNESSQSSFTISFTIPEGKIGYFSWDGEAWGDVEQYYNYCGVDMNDVPRKISGAAAFYQKGNGASAGSDDLDGVWKDFTNCIAGFHSFRFFYQKGGNGEIPEGDKYVVSNIRLKVEDFEKYNAELEEKEVTFKEIYVGPQRYTTAKVTLKNTGSEPLEVKEITASDPFYGIVPKETATFGSTLSVELWFYPGAKGTFDKSVTIKTSAGDFDVACHGVAKDYTEEGIIFLGDFEDDAYGWSLYDADKDGSCWNLGTNMWGTYYPDGYYTHGGAQCLASPSDYYNPDNWTFSPAITIPENGAKLSYYVAAFSPTSWLEHYSFYVAEDITNVEAVKATGAIIEETLEEAQGAMDGWIERTVDMKDYAGKTVYLCFRHHDTQQQYLLRLDDVVISKNDNSGIGSNYKSAQKAQTTYFNAAGQITQNPQKGLTIVRKLYEDGSVKTFKAIER